MCAVSAIINQVQTQFPPLQAWPRPALYDLREVIARLDAIDKRLAAKDCYERTKDEFLRALEQRIAEIEKQVRDSGQR